MTTDAGACGQPRGVGVAYGFADIRTTDISESDPHHKPDGSLLLPSFFDLNSDPQDRGVCP
jgi:hypothetical protein